MFWNLIYYFNDYLLPYDFILPYEDTEEFDKSYQDLKRNAKKVYFAKDSLDEEIKEEDLEDEEQ